MKYPAISVWQPWASLLVSGDKTYENRTWKLSPELIGKKILIHASKKKDKEEWETAADMYHVITNGKAALAPLEEDCFKFGGIIGYVIFDKVVTESESIWFAGNYGFHVKEFKELDFFPVRGHQKIFYVDLPKEYKL